MSKQNPTQKLVKLYDRLLKLELEIAQENGGVFDKKNLTDEQTVRINSIRPLIDIEKNNIMKKMIQTKGNSTDVEALRKENADLKKQVEELTTELEEEKEKFNNVSDELNEKRFEDDPWADNQEDKSKNKGSSLFSKVED